MKPKRTISSYALLIGVLSLSVVGGALIYTIYSSLVKTQITMEQQTLIKPLDGSIDTDTLNGLQNRRVFSQSELATQLVTQVSPTPEATAEAVSSPSAIINQP